MGSRATLKVETASDAARAMLMLVSILAVSSSRAEAAIENYSIFKRVAYTQTSDSQPTTPVGIDGGVVLFTGMPGDLSAVRVFSTSPTDLSPGSPFHPTEYSPGYWQSSQLYSSLAEMDVNLPPRDIFGYLIEGGDLGARLALLPVPATNLFTPDIPYFTNNAFSQLNGLDPTSPQTITWNGYTPLAGINDAPIFFSIFRVSDGQFMTGTTVLNSVTSFNVPANTLDSDTVYRAELAYSSRIYVPDAGFTTADTYTNFDLATALYFTTGSGAESTSHKIAEPTSVLLTVAGLLVVVIARRLKRRTGSLLLIASLMLTETTPAEAVDNYSLFKRIFYVQANDSQPTTPVAIDGGLGLFTSAPSDLTSARAFPTSTPGPAFEFVLTEYSPGFWGSAQFYPSLAEMDANLPLGDTFGFLIEGGSLGAQLGLLATPETNLFTPDIPYFTGNAFSQLNGVDGTAPFTVTWNGYTPLAGINDAPIFFSVFRVSDGQFMIGILEFNPTTSFLIPAGTLAPNTQYRAELDYSSRIFTPDVGFTSADTYVSFDVATSLQFTTAPLLPGDYNRDDVVDAADYVVWRKTVGQIDITPYSGADGDGDGDILPADYDVWRENFGTTAAGTGSLVLAVPESGGATLALWGIFAFVAASRLPCR